MDELKKIAKRIAGITPCCVISNNVEECKKIIKNMVDINYRDCPDGYLYDKKNNIVYIYEHFEIDCSPHNKKGSKLRCNLAKNEREIYREMNENSEGEILKNIEQGYSTKRKDGVVVFELYKNGDKYRNNYIYNFNNLFDKHYKQLDLYKKNCINELGIQEVKFKIIFVIEDVTLGGSYYSDGRKKNQPVMPLSTKQFREKLLNSDVDFFVFNSLSNIRLLTVLDKQCLTDEIVKNSIDLTDKEFCIFPSMVQVTSYKN